jgi:hypothetical protein
MRAVFGTLDFIFGLLWLRDIKHAGSTRVRPDNRGSLFDIHVSTLSYSRWNCMDSRVSFSSFSQFCRRFLLKMTSLIPSILCISYFHWSRNIKTVIETENIKAFNYVTSLHHTFLSWLWGTFSIHWKCPFNLKYTFTVIAILISTNIIPIKIATY